VLVCDEEIERRIIAGDSTQRIYEAACVNGMHSLWESALAHVRRGVTSVDELLRVVETPPDTVELPQGRRITDAIADPPPDRPRLFASDDGRSSTPVLQVFEGRAFDLLEDYPAGNAARRSVVVAQRAADARSELRSLLEAHGFDVHEAADGASALEVIDRTTPELVVLDLTLPRLDGYGVLEKLRTRAATKAMPVLVLAHGGDDDAEVRALESGANDYFTRPLRPRVLMARINALTKWYART
jgi:CheY-like chemotaxis protein